MARSKVVSAEILESVLKDRFFGGGLVPRMLGLIVGPRGIGKTTLGLQIAAWDAKHGVKAEFADGEMGESVSRDWMARLGIKKVKIFSRTADGHNINDINARAVLRETELVLVDSLHTTMAGDIGGDIGSRKQMEAVVERAAGALDRQTTIFVAHTAKNDKFQNVRIRDRVGIILHLERNDDGTTLLWASKNRFANLSDSKVCLRLTEHGFVVAE